MPIVPVRRLPKAAAPVPADDFSYVSPPARTRSPQFARQPAEGKSHRKHHKVDRTGPNWDEDGNYTIGRGRPPVEHQWRKGQSGNPKGPKPNEPLDPLANYDRMLLEPFRTTVNGQMQEITHLEFGLQALKKAAASGTARAAEGIIRECMSAIHRTVERNRTPETEQWEQDAIDQLLDRFGLPARPVVRANREDEEEA